MDYPYDYEDEYAEYDDEEQFQKIKKKNHKTKKPINQKAQIRQKRREKNKNKTNLERKEQDFVKEIFKDEEEDDWTDYGL